MNKTKQTLLPWNGPGNETTYDSTNFTGDVTPPEDVFTVPTGEQWRVHNITITISSDAGADEVTVRYDHTGPGAGLGSILLYCSQLTDGTTVLHETNLNYVIGAGDALTRYISGTRACHLRMTVQYSVETV